MMNETRKSE